MAEIKKCMVVIRENGRFVMEVCERTRQCTTRPQQFYVKERERPDELKLVIAPRSEWVSNPVIMDVDTWRVR